MGASWTFARAELRAHARSLIGLMLLVTLATAIVLAAVVGARRTATTITRYREWSVGIDASVQSDAPETARTLLHTARAQPYVSAATLRYLVNGFPKGASESLPDFAIFTDPANRSGVTIDRLRMLRGRMPDPRRPDEIVLDEPAARLLHRDVGDRLAVATWSQDDLDALFADRGFPGFDGPPLHLRVVGVARTLQGMKGDVQRTSLQAFAGPRFLAAHPGIGAWPPVVVVRLDRTDRAVQRLASALAAATGPNRYDVLNADAEYVDATRRTVGALSTGLWMFAGVAGLAALVAVGQAASRQVASAASAAGVARGLGMTRWRRAVTVAVPTLVAATIGVAAGALTAIALSPLLPFGIARRIEVSPGLWVDPPMLVVGAFAALMLVVGWVLLVAWRAQGRLARGSPVRTRRSSIAARVASWGVRPSVSTGVRAAFEGRDGSMVPIRSALAAVSVAIVGIVGAGVVASSLQALRAEPARWGWNWSSVPDTFEGGGSPPVARLVADRRIAAVADETEGSVSFGKLHVDGHSLRVLKGSLLYTLAAGRMPVGPSEVALDRQVMRELGASIGDQVAARARRGRASVQLTVVGTVVLPESAGSVQNGGVVLAPEGLAAVNHDQPQSTLLLRYSAGVDERALERDLRDRFGLSFGLFAHGVVPGKVANLDQGRGVALALAVFFSLLGIVGLAHALVVSTRRRARDFAVLRAVGFLRGQVRTAVSVQAIATVGAGLLVGIPVGLVVGRAVWGRLVSGLGVIDDPSTPWVLLLAVVPAAVVLAATVAWLPGRRAATAGAGSVLRGGE